MKRSMLHLLAVLVLASGATSFGHPLEYRVESVKGKLLRLAQGTKERLEAGSSAVGGDRLRTGWFSRANLAVDEAGARFAMGPSTTVLLASEQPGVILELERGRLRALFDSLAGRPPIDRLVATPSAVLAVRGTSYGVAVTRDGTTLVLVFEGVVQVHERSGLGEPVAVRAQEMVTVRRGTPVPAPRPHHTDPSAWDRGSLPPGWTHGAGPGSGSATDQGAGAGRNRGPSTGSGRHGG